MFEVSVHGSFTARHQLRLSEGTWEPLHEHGWRVEVTYAGPRLNAGGVLVDFVDVERLLAETLAPLQHQSLNSLAIFRERLPSAENVALHIAERMAAGAASDACLRCVAVEEAPGCVARYWPHE
jgi:6-pyruvoyltetrahydropterin/6-carboxytetrahydropterin synthase